MYSTIENFGATTPYIYYKKFLCWYKDMKPEIV